MTDSATEHAVINAPIDACFVAVHDFESYPEWAADIKATEIVERDDQDRATTVTFRAAAMGRSTTVTLRYDYSEAPDRLSWRLVDGDLLRRYDGSYELEPNPDDPATTVLDYELEVDLIVPLPGFVKRRAEARIIKAALPDLKDYIESGQAQPS